MKKFGTPIGAAPGSAKLNVGLAPVGTPPAPVSFGAGGFVDGFVEPLPFVPELFLWPEPFDLPWCDEFPRVREEGCVEIFGVLGCDWVRELELELLLELEVEVEDEVGVLVVVVVELAAGLAL
jgi:hypothetical protein